MRCGNTGDTYDPFAAHIAHLPPRLAVVVKALVGGRFAFVGRPLADGAGAGDGGESRDDGGEELHLVE